MRNSVLPVTGVRVRTIQCAHCCATAEDARRRSPGRGQPVCTLSARRYRDSVVFRDRSVWDGTKNKLNQKQQIELDDYNAMIYIYKDEVELRIEKTKWKVNPAKRSLPYHTIP